MLAHFLLLTFILKAFAHSDDHIDIADIEDAEPLGFSYKQCGLCFVLLLILTIQEVLATLNLEVSPCPLIPLCWDKTSLSRRPGPSVCIMKTKHANAVEQAGTSSSMQSVALKIDKKIGVWVPIPCIDGVGSCTYNDVCSMLEKDKEHICPVLEPLGIPCACPISVGTYSLGAKGLSAFLKNPNLSWLTNGDFYVQATVSGAGGTYFCIELYVSLTTN